MRVGIVLSSYNRPAGLLAALDSLSAQTHQDWVVVVADDHSEDPEVARVAELARADPRVLVLRGHRKFSIEEKRRTCTLSLRVNEAQVILRAAKCDLFAYLLDDVVYHPTRLAEHVRLLEENSGVFLVWGEQWLVRYDAAGNVVEERRQVPEQGLGQVSQAYLRQRLATNNFINHCSATHRDPGPGVRWSTRPQAWHVADLLFWRDLVAAGAGPFMHTTHVGETMSSGPWDLGPSIHHRGETIADVAARRGGR